MNEQYMLSEVLQCRNDLFERLIIIIIRCNIVILLNDMPAV